MIRAPSTFVGGKDKGYVKMVYCGHTHAASSLSFLLFDDARGFSYEGRVYLGGRGGRDGQGERKSKLSPGYHGNHGSSSKSQQKPKLMTYLLISNYHFRQIYALLE